MTSKPRLEARVEPRTNYARSRSRTVTNGSKSSDDQEYNDLDATLFGDYPPVATKRDQVNWHEFLTQIDNHMAKQNKAEAHVGTTNKKAKAKVKSVSSSTDLFNKYSRKSPMTTASDPNPGTNSYFPGAIINHTKTESHVTRLSRDSATSKSIRVKNSKTKEAEHQSPTQVASLPNMAINTRSLSGPSLSISPGDSGRSGGPSYSVSSQPTAARPPVPAGIRLDRRLSQVRANGGASTNNIPNITARRNSTMPTTLSDFPPQVSPIALTLPNLHVPIPVSTDSEAYVTEQRNQADFKRMLGGFVQSQKELETGIYTSIWASNPESDQDKPVIVDTEKPACKAPERLELSKHISRAVSPPTDELDGQLNALESFQRMKATIDRISKQEQYQMCYKGTKPATTRMRTVHTKAQSPTITVSRYSPQVKMSSMSHSASASASSSRTAGSRPSHIRSSSTETLSSNFSIAPPKSRSPSYSPSDVALLGGDNDRAARNTLVAKSRQLLLSGLSFAGEMLIPHDLQPSV